ncbi:MAG: MFS transporter, partial [Planctomycetota bacterium]
APVLLVLGVFEASRRACHYALSKPARETLFTVVPRADKYKAKGIIDTFVYRGGDTVGTVADAGLVIVGLAAAWLAVPLGVGALLLGVWLGNKEEEGVPEHDDSNPAPTPGAAPMASPAGGNA